MLIRNGCLPFTPTQMYYHHRQLRRLWYPRQWLRIPWQPTPLLLLLLPNALQTPPLHLPLLIKWTEVSWHGVYCGYSSTCLVLHACAEHRELELGAVIEHSYNATQLCYFMYFMYSGVLFLSYKATEGNATAPWSSATRLNCGFNLYMYQSCWA